QKASDIVYKAYTADMKKAVSQKLGSEEATNMSRVDRSWARFNGNSAAGNHGKVRVSQNPEPLGGENIIKSFFIVS
ncbi:hypothetical protein MJN69_30375, partial [Salmonella enterica subsp. enterica serovar Kentucky]|nr:hypothetical protein [Salmonella enterica subsp. enterica serovar Kentucky]